MPKMACNGFSMFANSVRAELEAERGGERFGGMEDLIRAATPLWASLTVDEKVRWKDRAKDYRKTIEYRERKRTIRRRAGKLPLPAQGGGPSHLGAAPSLHHSAPADSEDNDYDSDFDPGVPMVRGPLPIKTSELPPAPQTNTQELFPTNPTVPLPKPLMSLEPPTPDVFLQHKLAADKARLTSFLLASSPNTKPATLLATMKRCRWLSASVQTYGLLPGAANSDRRIPAELALVEWSLAGGILEEYFRILGPWAGKLDSAAEAAAEAWAKRTHDVPLSGCPEYGEFTACRRSVLRNVLGRVEPAIAVGQGLGVGLYAEGVGGGRPEDLLLPGELGSGRRWLVVLGREWEELQAGLAELASAAGITYDGLPLSPERLVLAEAVTEVAVELSGAAAEEATVADLAGTGRWDDVEGMYCSFHAPRRNRHCAIAVVRKTLFAMFALLKTAYNLPFYV